MLAGILVALMLIVCVCFELCMVPPARDRNDTAEGE
jgi:hypothetical protein